MTQPVDRARILARCAAGDRWYAISQATGHHWRTIRRIAKAAGYGSYGVGMPCRAISAEEQLIGHLVELIGIQPTARRLARPLGSIAYIAKRVGVQSPFRRGRPRKHQP